MTASVFTHTMHYNKKIQDMMMVQNIFTVGLAKEDKAPIQL